MKALLWIVAVALVIIAGFYTLNSFIYDEKQGDDGPMATSTKVSEIVPIEHASLILKKSVSGNTDNIYVDPVGSPELYSGEPAADIVLITDIHGDHYSSSTLAAVVNQDTLLIVPQAVKDILPGEIASKAREVRVLKNGDTYAPSLDLEITAVPMYNLPERENSNFHAKGRGNGYVIARDGLRTYIAGDSAGTPEMKALTGIDVAFVPMNLPYTMSVEEAAEAVLAFKPTKVYPYHFRGPDGLADVEKFKQLVNAENPNIEVVLRDWYPTE